MQTLNFQCGHCQGLMAVSAEFLGQQVRCPHCQQVVIAPSATGPAPEPPQETAAPPLQVESERHDDIFSQHGTFEDAIFGNTEAPRLELPAEPAPPAPVVPPIEAPPPSEPANHGEAAAPAPVPAWQPPFLAEPSAAPAPAPELPPGPAPEPPAHYVPSPAPTMPRQPRGSGGGSWFILIVVIPLFLYAAAMTAMSIFLYLRLTTQRPSLFDQMPDLNGDNPGVRKTGKELSFRRGDALAPLPDHLKVALGKTLRVGDLEVTPLGVQRRRVSVFSQGSEKPEPCEGDSLVLRLRLKNVAKGYAFTPIDNYFDRWWDGRSGSAPLTVLLAGDTAFFGGPAHWLPVGSSKGRREWVEGRKNNDTAGLKPGESMVTFVCTDGEDKKAVATLDPGRGYKGGLLWRVNLRRGLIEHKGRKLPAQCVVGVRFTSKDYGG